MISVFGSLISTTNISINILKLKKYILDLSRNKDTDHFSNQGGWQGALALAHPSLIDLKKEILIHTQEYLKSLDFKQGLFYSFKSMFTTVWKVTMISNITIYPIPLEVILPKYIR